MKRADIRAAIATETAQIPNRTLTETYGTIANATERRELLTQFARAKDAPLAAIRAVDVLNKMDGAYIEQHEHRFPTAPIFAVGILPSVSKEQERG